MCVCVWWWGGGQQKTRRQRRGGGGQGVFVAQVNSFGEMVAASCLSWLLHRRSEKAGQEEVQARGCMPRSACTAHLLQ